MPAPNTVNVSIDSSNPQNPAVVCDPEQLVVDASAPGAAVVITFVSTTPGWVFPNVNDGQTHFYGISLADNPNGEFSNPQRSPDGTVVSITDLDDTTTSYQYTAQLTNPSTGQTLGVDPRITNPGGG